MALKDGAILQSVPQNIHLHFRKKKPFWILAKYPSLHLSLVNITKI